MFHSTSGKRGYSLNCIASCPVFPREKLREVLIKEDELRNSERIQNLYSREFATGNEFLCHVRDVTLELQREALLQCGVSEENLDAQLSSFQCHRAHYANDEEILKLSVYGRHDKTSEGDFSNGANLDVELYELDGKIVSLRSLLKPERCTVIISSSIT